MAAASNVYRGYHSNALLLPDGRVLVSGGNHDRARTEERGDLLAAVPVQGPATDCDGGADVVELGDTIFVETPDAATSPRPDDRPGFSHARPELDAADQSLDFAVTDGGLNIELPANGNDAPPGYYMLFLVNSAGVPSVAEWMRAELPRSARRRRLQRRSTGRRRRPPDWQRQPAALPVAA